MENASDALLIAFAVLIFIIALSVSLTSLVQAKSTADIVLFYSDRENFQTPLKSDLDYFEDGGRTVGVDTVIATIVRCSKEKFAVKIIDGSKTYNFEYDTQTEEEIKAEINRFLDTNPQGIYRETYVEVTTSGKVYKEEDGKKEDITTGGEYLGKDGTTLEVDVAKKIYITYEKRV